MRPPSRSFAVFPSMAVLPWVLMVAGHPALGQNATKASPLNLPGVQGLIVEIFVADEFVDLGLSSPAIRADVEKLLTSAGIQIPNSRQARQLRRDDALSYLNIDITGVADPTVPNHRLMFYVVRVFLKQPVALATGGSGDTVTNAAQASASETPLAETLLAETWFDREIGIIGAPNVTQLRTAVTDLVETFLYEHQTVPSARRR